MRTVVSASITSSIFVHFAVVRVASILFFTIAWSPLSKAQDSDMDGLDDIDEIQIYGTNPFVADTDGDGLTDGFEVGVGRINIVKMGDSSYSTAKAHAAQSGVSLFTSRSDDEFRAMRHVLGKAAYDKFLWIGMTFQEDAWIWNDGFPDAAFYWAGQERTDTKNGEHFAAVDNRIDGDGGFRFSVWSFSDHPSGNRISGYISEIGNYSNPLEADSDHDGFNDSAEYMAQTDPQDPNVNPKGRVTIHSAVEFAFFSEADLLYEIQGSHDLVSWVKLEGPILGIGGEISRLFSIKSNSVKFYRVQTKK